MHKVIYFLFLISIIFQTNAGENKFRSKETLLINAVEIIKSVKKYKNYIVLNGTGIFNCQIKKKNSTTIFRGSYAISKKNLIDLDGDGKKEVILVIGKPVYLGCIEKITLIILKQTKNNTLKVVFISNDGFIPNSHYISISVNNKLLKIVSSMDGSILGDFDDILHFLDLKMRGDSLYINECSYDSSWELESGSTPTSYRYNFENKKYHEHWEEGFEGKLVEYEAEGVFELKKNKNPKYTDKYRLDECKNIVDKLINKFPNKVSRRPIN